jgi:hypothetical protein
MGRVIEGHIYRMGYAVGRSVKEPILIEAQDTDDADRTVLAFAAKQEGYAGENISIISVSVLDPETL